ncbi:hypothetical protein EST38_g7390 [Candolleomyces aberdarensis]|uniref:Uncharacterized protein n=1 Tax=Candolleomyces aberdarensis TaxID=2316362 RepID=A0A4V1Q3G1_9AGAR|nr:hypothetical protein EST38_g7390 [Candolleomyces aberdarensis]
MEGGSGGSRNDTRASTPTTPKAQSTSQNPDTQPPAGYPPPAVPLHAPYHPTQQPDPRLNPQSAPPGGYSQFNPWRRSWIRLPSPTCATSRVPSRYQQHTYPATRESSAALSESGLSYEGSTTGSMSETETTATTATPARPNKRRRLAEPLAQSSKEEGTSTRATHNIPDKMVLERLQLQYAQISDRLDHLSANLAAPAAQAQPLTRSEEMLQQVLKGYQETNAILREGLRAQSDQAGPDVNVKAEVGGEPMDIDPAQPLLQVEVKKAPICRTTASKAVARIVREYFNEIFKGNVEDRAAVRGFRASEGPSCTIDDFKLDLQGPPGAEWNISAKKVFLRGLMDAKANDLSQYKPSAKVLERLFVSNFKNARAKLKWQQMSEPQREITKQAHRRAERKRWLYFRRMKAADRFEDTKRHVPMIAAYGWEGMSTDESDHENGTGGPDYAVLNKKWRNPNAAACLQTLDALHRDSRFKKNRRVTAGAHPHERSLSHKMSTSRPVPRLPSGLYDP